MSTGAYSPGKARLYPERLNVINNGGQPYPVHLHLIISDLCNLDCPGCAYRMIGYSSNQRFNVLNPDGTSNHNPNRMLDVHQVESILRDFKEMGGEAVEVTGGGEPTVHPHCARILKYALDLNLDVALITNGILLNRIPKHVLARLTWMRVSIDAASADVFAKVRPGFGKNSDANFGNILTNVGEARKMLDEMQSHCVLGTGFVVQKENWHEIDRAAQLYKAAGAHNIRISGLFSPEKEEHFRAWKEEALALEQKAMTRQDENFKVIGRLSEKIEDLQARPNYALCGYEHFTTYIGADGNLYRCCVTSYNDHGFIGNIAEAGGFKKLWDSKQKKERFSSFNASSCDRCQFNDRNRDILAALQEEDDTGFVKMPGDVAHKSFV